MGWDGLAYNCMSDQTPTQFTMSSARRIASAVRRVESGAFGSTDIRRRRAFNEDGYDGLFMYKVVSGTGGTFTVRPGIWQRGFNTSPSSHKAEYQFDPITGDGTKFPVLITNSYTGLLHVYTQLLNSDGSGYTLTASDDFSNDSTIYDHGNDGSTTGQMIVCSVNPIVKDLAQQFKHIATLTYDNGEITAVAQTRMGAISDTPDEMFDVKCQFSLLIKYDAATRDYTIKVQGGRWRVRGNTITAADGSDEPSSKYAWYVTATTNAATDTRDTSLATTSAYVVAAVAFPDDTGYTFYYKRLFSQSRATITASSGVTAVSLYYPTIDVVYHTGGDVEHDWVRPDGKDIGGLFATLIDGGYPRIKSLNFNTTACPHQAELQDYNAYETILGSAMYYTGDKVISWFDVNTAGTTVKMYAYVDSHGASLGTRIDAGLSLQISGSTNRLQIYGFSDGSPNEQITTLSSFFTGTDPSTGIGLLARKVIGGKPTIEYVSLYGLTMALPSHSIKSDHTDSPDNPAGAHPPADKDMIWWRTGLAPARFEWVSASTLSSSIEHTKLVFTPDPTLVPLVGLGKSLGNTDHDDAYWHAWYDNIPAHLNYVDGKDYRTRGAVWIHDLRISSDGINQVATPNNQWYVYASSSVNTLDVFNVHIGAGFNIVSDMTGYTSLIKSYNLQIFPQTVSMGALEIGNTTNKWGTIEAWSNGKIDLKAGAASVWQIDGNLDIRPGSAGKSIWIGKGGGTGAPTAVWANFKTQATNMDIYGDNTGNLKIGNPGSSEAWVGVDINVVTAAAYLNFTVDTASVALSTWRMASLKLVPIANNAQDLTIGDSAANSWKSLNIGAWGSCVWKTGPLDLVPSVDTSHPFNLGTSSFRWSEVSVLTVGKIDLTAGATSTFDMRALNIKPNASASYDLAIGTASNKWRNLNIGADLSIALRGTGTAALYLGVSSGGDGFATISAYSVGKIDLTAGAASAWAITGNLGITTTGGYINLTAGASSLFNPSVDASFVFNLGDAGGNSWYDIFLSATRKFNITTGSLGFVAQPNAPATGDFTIGDAVNTYNNIVINGTNGFSGTVANPTSITVTKGLVTACS